MPVDVSMFLERNASAPTPRLPGHGCFIRGARRRGKTSFAFQAAVNTVQDGARAVVLCQEHVLYSKMPQPFTPLTMLDEAALRRIEFVYVESLADVVREVGGWSTPHEAPALVLVDDDSLTDAGDVRRTAQVLSALENVHEWLTRIGQVFHYVLVSNSFAERQQSVELPFAAFPLVNALFGSAGTVSLQPTQSEMTQMKPLRLEWRDGLVLQTDHPRCSYAALPAE
ncbi:hypothetical protein DQ04_05301030 [Trypanosoma grayi]|uniref:hypothetical protein n=1 Tax=Trypanosoma grayi TaxID=71804 RepID=UPI0004F48640|nr:hypothetical protein DQ04_05301030 [Trypanosoma grayi]KEG09389.1 hypothetical protein DQ04_05301030 [Trypanosoma grayi]